MQSLLLLLLHIDTHFPHDCDIKWMESNAVTDAACVYISIHDFNLFFLLSNACQMLLQLLTFSLWQLLMLIKNFDSILR